MRSAWRAHAPAHSWPAYRRPRATLPAVADSLERDARKLHTGPNAELTVHLAQVIGDGMAADIKLIGDLPVGQARATSFVMRRSMSVRLSHPAGGRLADPRCPRRSRGGEAAGGCGPRRAPRRFPCSLPWTPGGGSRPRFGFPWRRAGRRDPRRPTPAPMGPHAGRGPAPGVPDLLRALPGMLGVRAEDRDRRVSLMDPGDGCGDRVLAGPRRSTRTGSRKRSRRSCPGRSGPQLRTGSSGTVAVSVTPAGPRAARAGSHDGARRAVRVRPMRQLPAAR